MIDSNSSPDFKGSRPIFLTSSLHLFFLNLVYSRHGYMVSELGYLHQGLTSFHSRSWVAVSCGNFHFSSHVTSNQSTVGPISDSWSHQQATASGSTIYPWFSKNFSKIYNHHQVSHLPSFLEWQFFWTVFFVSSEPHPTIRLKWFFFL